MDYPKCVETKMNYARAVKTALPQERPKNLRMEKEDLAQELKRVKLESQERRDTINFDIPFQDGSVAKEAHFELQHYKDNIRTPRNKICHEATLEEMIGTLFRRNKDNLIEMARRKTLMLANRGQTCQALSLDSAEKMFSAAHIIKQPDETKH